MSRRIVVTGTDTGIGKTVFAAGLADLLGACYWKPIQSGLEGETDSADRRAAGRLVRRSHSAGALSAEDAGFAAPSPLRSTASASIMATLDVPDTGGRAAGDRRAPAG